MLTMGKKLDFEADIEKATNENNLTDDWSSIMQICDNAINYQDGAKICLKAIVKRLHHNVPRVVLQTLTLLDACVKNCDRRFLLQVASSEFTTEVRKLLAKMHPSAALKFKELLQRWSLEEFKDDAELCIIPSLYYKLKSEGMEFLPMEKEKKRSVPICTDPNAVTSQEEENDIIKAIEISLKDTGRYSVPSELGSSNLGSETSLKESFKVRTLYDFDAAEDNELTIKTGEIVLVLDNSSTSWWKGSNHRGEGLFPANFVTEDLDFKAEEITVETISTAEPVPDTSFVGEVKLDEEKIEKVVNWLNETDPAEELSDPEEMLRLEDEVHKMTSLIEENLHSIDKRLAMLNLVNEKIMASFDLFHTLSDHYSGIPPAMNMKYYTVPSQGPMQPQGTMTSETVMHPGMQMFPQQIMYVPVPPPNVQHALTNDQANNKQTPTTQVINQQGPPTTTVHQAPSSENTSGNNVGMTNSVSTSSEGQITHPAMMMNPYNAPVGGFYVPQPMPFPYQYPPNVHQQPQPNLPQQGSSQTSGSATSFMNIPYAMPSMWPSIPFPCYYTSSNSSSAQINNPPNLNPNQESSKKIPSNSAASTKAGTTSSAPTYPTYSNDLYQITYSTPGTVSKDSNETNGLSQ